MYEIIEVPAGSAESTEQLGTKYKFWYSDAQRRMFLFKEGRPGTGENWAEKIACELAELIKMPHATYDFAKYEQREGVVTLSLTSSGGVRLVHGNELLETATGEGDKTLPNRKEHTLRRVMSYFRGGSELIGTPPSFNKTQSIFTALDVFIGYLMFDAWIANQDRHAENWAILRDQIGNIFLSPSYDHGSSMGRNESDEKRKRMLTTKDKGQHISHYVQTARSAFFPSPTQEKSKFLSTFDAFSIASRLNANAAHSWQEILSGIDKNSILKILDNVPRKIMTDIAKEFSLELLTINQSRVIECKI